VAQPSPRIGIHLPLGIGLPRAARRAEEIRPGTVQLFADNPNAWARRTAPPPRLDVFRNRLAALDVSPVVIHSAYLVNLAGPEPGFREASIRVLTTDLQAAAGYGASIVNVHIGSHRDTSVEAGIERVAEGVARAAEIAGPGADGVRVSLENSSGGGWTLGSEVRQLAAIAEAAARQGVPEGRLGFCLDTAHAWGAGIAMNDPDVIDAWLASFDAEIGLQRLALVHLNDSRSELGSRQDRHEHVGAGQIGEPGLGHLLRHPALAEVPFILETPGMDVGYDAINLDRARRMLAGESLPQLPPEAFTIPGSRSRGVAPPDVRAGDADEGE
jgi:deoxyribonuclease-4